MEQTCDGCGRTFTTTRPAKYCSGRCRTTAYRKRHEPDRPEPRHQPLPDALHKAVPDVRRSVRRLLDLTRDERMATARKAVLTPGRSEVASLALLLVGAADKLAESAQTPEAAAAWAQVRKALVNYQNAVLDDGQRRFRHDGTTV